MRALARALVLLALAGALAGCAGRYFADAGAPPSTPRFELADWPYREYWTGIVFNGNKIGYAHLELAPAGRNGLYEIRAESALRLRFLGYEKRVTLRSRDLVRADLSLESFEYAYNLDGADLVLEGRVDRNQLRVKIVNAGRASEQILALTEPVFPASAIALLPALRGLAIGAEYEYTVYSGEAQRLAPVMQRVTGYERSEFFEGAAWKISTEMLGLQATTWIDARGRPVLEIALNGVMISGLEDDDRARRELAEGALGRDEALLDVALIRVTRPIGSPETLSKVRLALRDGPSGVVPPSDARQTCRMRAEGAECEIVASGLGPASSTPAPGTPDRAYLRGSLAVPSTDPEIRTLAASIAAGRETPVAQARAILDWIGANIRQTPSDAFTALDVLRKREAECQGHAYLYAALARALGIPTRIANGLVYSDVHRAFAFHTWAESVFGGEWIPVDPTFGQLPADLTHLKLVEGENPADLVPLAAWIGRTRIDVLEAR